jgi:glucokinase
MKKTILGIDIGGTNTVFGLVDEGGNILARGGFQTWEYPIIDSYQRALYKNLDRLIRQVGEVEVVGVGIGAPNANHRRGTIEHAPNLPWRGIVPFVGQFQSYFPSVPVQMINDADAAALGEKIYGGAREMDHFLVVTLGTGLGSGFFTNGELLLGHDGFAGELGHVIVEPAGRQCGCGRRGCLETYVSATGICRTLFELQATEVEPSDLRLIDFYDLTAEMISEAALDGDPLALRAYESTGERLGRALANTVLITEPEAIFLTGGLARAGELLFEPVRRYMEEYMLATFRGKVTILPSTLPKEDAAILGAAALIRHGERG